MLRDDLYVYVHVLFCRLGNSYSMPDPLCTPYAMILGQNDKCCAFETCLDVLKKKAKFIQGLSSSPKVKCKTPCSLGFSAGVLSLSIAMRGYSQKDKTPAEKRSRAEMRRKVQDPL